MDHSYLLDGVAALLEIGDYLANRSEYFYCEFCGIARNKHFGIVLGTEPSGLRGIQATADKELHDLLLEALVELVLLHVLHPLAAGVSDQQVRGLGLEVVEVEPANVVHGVVIIVDEVDDVDESVGYAPVDAAQVASGEVAAEVYLLVGLPEGLAAFLHHLALLGGVELQLLLLEGLDQVHLLVLGVDLVEYLLVVAIEPQVEQLLVQVQRRVAHDRLRRVEDLGIQSQL